MKRFIVSTIATSVLVWLALPADAQQIIHPARKASPGQLEFGAVAGLSMIEYDGDGGEGSGDIDRKLMGGYGALGLMELVDVYGTLGIFTAEPEDWDDTGAGWLIAAGARSAFKLNDQFSIHGYGQLQYLSEDYGETSESESGYYASASSKMEATGTFKELLLGGAVRFTPVENLGVYAALELIPYSDGEVEVDASTTVSSLYGGTHSESVSQTADIERDGLIGLRLGADLVVGQFYGRGELALLSETALLIGAGIAF